MHATIKPIGRGQRQRLEAIFDTAYYLRQYVDVAEADVDPLTHFLTIGWAECRNPCALFDTELYLERNPDVARAGLNPLIHYIKAGAREGRQVSLLFDPQWYLAKNPDIADAARANPLAHYLTTGAVDGREANPLFDQAWYLARYPQALKEAPCALAHYAERGLRERLSPHPLFDGAFYLDKYPDVACAGVNPLAHFLLRGHMEARQPHPLFHAEWYLRTYPDVAQARMNPLLHYLQNGAREGRNPSPEFDTQWYVNAYLGVGEIGVNPLVHYVEYGRENGHVARGTSASDASNQESLQSSTPKETPLSFEALLAARDIARQSNAVAVVCWDGAHNPIGRAKVLYDTLDGRRPVVLFSYLFAEFGGRLWPPLQSARMQYVGIPWSERDSCHELLHELGIRFDTIWICKPRLPSFFLAEKLSHDRTKLILDLDDNEEHFARSQGSRNKCYGLPSIGLTRRLTDRVRARTVVSRTLKADFGGEIVRHARARSGNLRTLGRQGEPKVGFLGTVRPHKNILGAARAVRQFSEENSLKPVFHVHGDVAPTELKAALTAAGAVVHGVVPSGETESVIRECGVMITGFPSDVSDDQSITKYQVTAKIGDSLTAGRPVLVPDSASVRDLEGVNGVYLFDESTFSSVLERALQHSSPITLPEEFTFAAAARAFSAAENQSENFPRAGEVFAELRTGTRNEARPRAEECLILLWKQHDAGIYGRRIDQIARSYKRAKPDARVIVLELMHSSSLAFYHKNASDWTSDFAEISRLARRKAGSGFRDADGVEYRTLLFSTDRELPRDFTEFAAREQLIPDNTVIVAFPIIRSIEAVLDALRSFPLVVDFVDNQFAWASADDRDMYANQYKSLAAAARRLVFNSERNSAFFRNEGLIPAGADVKIISNWYQLPKALIGAPMPAKSKRPSVVYSGNMNDRIDWDLVRAIADTSVDVNLIGNAYRAAPEFWELLEHRSVTYHGPLKECDAICVAAASHLAIMPHTSDAFSDFMNPLKLHMYAAIGLPVISTRVEGLLTHELIHIASDQSQFVAAIGRCLEKISVPASAFFRDECLNSRAAEYFELISSTRRSRDSVWRESRTSNDGASPEAGF